MSRHKLVKNLDLDDELDDFDGGEDYGYEGDGGVEELSEEDQEQMRIGIIAVRENLPEHSTHITDRQIQDALWHYYYDVEKSVLYLTSTFVAKPKAKEAKKTENVKGPVEVSQKSFTPMSQDTFSFRGFFQDTPWLNVPHERLARFIEPSYRRGGLLGGSGDMTPKVSKLQALAAARKKKTQESKSAATGVEKPMASLKLNEANHGKNEPSSNEAQKPLSRGFPTLKRKDSSSHEKSPRSSPTKRNSVTSPPRVETPKLDQATPSAFANAMFSNAFPNTASQRSSIFTLPYTPSSLPAASDPFAGPSPDDLVIAAQSKASGKGGKGTPKVNNEKKSDKITNGVEALKISDTPRAKSKNLDVLKEFENAKPKNAANFVVIGHVDAGKSTLMGRLLYDLKVVDQRTVDRYRKEAEKMGKSSFALAWVLDQGTEERNRGVTIDIASNKFETEKTCFTILDAPGHRDFIPNMLAGAAQADFAVLVVDASTGSFESGLKGQTKEHALLVRSMGVQRMIIAVNKLDTVNWDQERFTEIEQQISAFLTTAGFLSKNITFIPCSGLHGDNITRRSSESVSAWYKGPLLVEELDNSEPISRALTKPLRLTVGDIFRGGVQNPLSISGRIEAGSLQVGDALLAQPSSETCYIKSLEIDNEPADWAVAGQNVTVHLNGIEEQYLKIGDVLCHPSVPITNIKQFTAKVLAFEFMTPMQVDVHRGRLHAAGKIKDIVAVLDKNSGAVVGKKKPRVVKPAQLVRVIVELETEVPLEAPARVVLRSNGETVAAGLLE